MSSQTVPLDVVVAHYNESGRPHIRFMTLHAVAHLLSREPAPDLNVIVVDGSSRRDQDLAGALAGLGARYVHCGRRLSFGETYNAGIRQKTSSPVVVTLANDIFIEARQVRLLAAEVKDGVGCAMPYLTRSDFGAQRTRRLPVPRRCYPTRMTLNANAFSRAALERIGLIPEDFSGCFNDVVLFFRLREAGYSIVLRNVGRVVHLAQQTLKTGATSVDYEADAERFAREWPRYWRRGVILFHKQAQRRSTRLLYGVVERLPRGWAKRLGLWRAAWAIEPYLCAERGTYREGLRRLMPWSRLGRTLPAREGASRA